MSDIPSNEQIRTALDNAYAYAKTVQGGKNASYIPALAQAILEDFSHKLRRPFTLTEDAVTCLQAHDWPGNVRELRNVLEFSAYLTPSGIINREALPSDLVQQREDVGLTLAQRTRAFEKRVILNMLERNGTSLEGKKRTAAQLGISLASLYNKLN